MPWTSRIDSRERLIYTHVSGSLTRADAIGHRIALTADPLFDGSFRNVLDLRSVTAIDLTTDDLIALASQSALTAEAKQAIVAPTDEAFGISRLYYFYRHMDPAHEDITVCRTLTQALSRLGVKGLPPPYKV